MITGDSYIGSNRQHRLSDQISANTDQWPDIGRTREFPVVARSQGRIFSLTGPVSRSGINAFRQSASATCLGPSRWPPALENKLLGGDMLDADRAAQLTDQLLKVIMSELEREPRTPDNVWCVLDAVACVVAGLIKEPEALRYYGRALNRYSRDFTTAADNPSHNMGRTKTDDAL